ncbi:tetraspanin-33 isoform X3 [Parus major]|uniref:tetraspanin-33 isoform X3 n=1 Tax=Parus major TaxID=9157 RepID=UPI0014445FAC|nr:tetraspanin-33 isoform X3 [Parus major]
MARRTAAPAGPLMDDFSFVSPVVKYVLFFFNLLFWMISMVMVAVGVYARLLKHAEAAMACLAVDPAILLIMLAAGVLGFVFSDKARGKVSEIINGAIVHYRDDLDLQNLIDFGQKEFSCCGGVSYKDWSQNVYFNCTATNPSRERCSVPFSCCLHDAEQAVINTMCGHGMQARGYLEASAFIHTNGCIDKLVNWTHSNLFLLGGITLGLALPQVRGQSSACGVFWGAALMALILNGLPDWDGIWGGAVMQMSGMGGMG